LVVKTGEKHATSLDGDQRGTLSCEFLQVGRQVGQPTEDQQIIGVLWPSGVVRVQSNAATPQHGRLGQHFAQVEVDQDRGDVDLGSIRHALGSSLEKVPRDRCAPVVELKAQAVGAAQATDRQVVGTEEAGPGRKKCPTLPGQKERG